MSRRVGVLALQGDVPEHAAVLAELGAEVVGVRRPSELERCDALVLPGGESTTMIKLAKTFGLLKPLRDWVASDRPTFGTCAGMILLADRVLDGAAEQPTIGGLDITVRRNAFGRQVDSFEAELPVTGISDPVHAVFIRAPWVESVGEGVEVLATAREHPVAVRQDRLLATSFHPEIDGDGRLHQLFLSLA